MNSNKQYQVFQIYKVHSMLDLSNKYIHNARLHFYGEDGRLLKNEEEVREYYLPEYRDWNTREILKEGISSRWKDTVAGRNITRKVQKNASPALEFVVSASDTFAPDWRTDERDRKKWEDYFKDAGEWFNGKYGDDIILNKAIHWDETTPHMHLLITPILHLTEKEKTKPKNAGHEWKFSSSEFLGGPAGMNRLHTEFWEEVSKKHGLDRGTENSRMKHSELKNYRAVLRSKEKAMEIQRELYQENKYRVLMENKAKLDCIYRSANRVFDEERKKEWKSKGDIPEELPKTGYDESADSYRLRISPHIHSFYEKCRNVFSRNQKLESVMGKGFSVGFFGKRYRFNTGLVHAFKSTLYNLNRMFGVSPEQLGGVQIATSNNSQNYDDDIDFMDEPEVRNHRRYVAEMERD